MPAESNGPMFIGSDAIFDRLLNVHHGLGMPGFGKVDKIRVTTWQGSRIERLVCVYESGCGSHRQFPFNFVCCLRETIAPRFLLHATGKGYKVEIDMTRIAFAQMIEG